MPPPAIVSRTEWGAQNPTSVTSYSKENYPVSYVYFSMKSGYPDCNGKEECIKALVEAQKNAMEKDKLSDIPYNFLISKDGTIFEGRGWETKPEKAIMMEKVDFDPRAYDIAFFGDYSTEDLHLPDSAFKASLDLLDDGVKRKYVDEQYDMDAFRADTFEPVFRPGPEKFKNIKPIEIKERVTLKQTKGKHKYRGKRPPPRPGKPGQGPQGKGPQAKGPQAKGPQAKGPQQAKQKQQQRR